MKYKNGSSIYQQDMLYVGLTTIDSIFKIWASPGVQYSIGTVLWLAD